MSVRNWILIVVTGVLAVGGVVGWLLGADLAGLGVVAAVVTGVMFQLRGNGRTTPPAVLVIAAAGLLASCGPALLTADQGEAGRHTLALGCDVVRELVRPGILPVSADEAALADRICAGVELVGGVVLAELSGPQQSANYTVRTGALSDGSVLPQVAAYRLVARCARPGLSEGARDVCGELFRAAQERRDLTLVRP